MDVAFYAYTYADNTQTTTLEAGLRNLINRQTVEQWTLTDRLSASSSYRLLPRLVLAGASLKF